MTLKTILIALSWISALGISYFAFDTLTSLGDWGHALRAEPLALVFALFVTIPPTVAVWMGIIMIEQSQIQKKIWTWFLVCSVGSWAWLYLGAVILAVMRLQ